MASPLPTATRSGHPGPQRVKKSFTRGPPLSVNTISSNDNCKSSASARCSVGAGVLVLARLGRACFCPGMGQRGRFTRCCGGCGAGGSPFASWIHLFAAPGAGPRGPHINFCLGADGDGIVRRFRWRDLPPCGRLRCGAGDGVGAGATRGARSRRGGRVWICGCGLLGAVRAGPGPRRIS